MAGASLSQQNVYLVRAAENLPQRADPFVLLNVEYFGEPLDGLYFWQEGDETYHLLARADQSVGQAFGALSYEGPPVPLTATTTPQKLVAFDTVQPSSGPVGIVPDPDEDSIIANIAGVFYVYARVTAEISSGTAYNLEFYNNDAPTGIRAAVDASNQTSGIFLSLSGIRNTTLATDLLDLRVNTDAGTGAFNIVNAEFGIYRISSFGEGIINAD